MRGIYVRCKPGDNGSAWEFQLCPPPTLDDSSMLAVYARLELYEKPPAEPEDPAEDGETPPA